MLKKCLKDRLSRKKSCIPYELEMMAVCGELLLCDASYILLGLQLRKGLAIERERKEGEAFLLLFSLLYRTPYRFHFRPLPRLVGSILGFLAGSCFSTPVAVVFSNPERSRIGSPLVHGPSLRAA